ACDVCVDLCLPVVGFDLGGQRVPGQAQVLDEALRDLLPVCVWNRSVMGCVGAGCTVDLAQVLGLLDAVQLAGQAPCQYCQFLAQGGWGSWLAVGAREHRHFTGIFSHLGQLGHQIAGGWQPYLLYATLDAQSVGEVVDVFGGAAEVHQRLEVSNADRFQAVGDVVLHCLHIVHGDRFDLGQFLDGICIEIGNDLAQGGLLFRSQRGSAWKYGVVGQVDQPFNFNVNAIAVQSRFGKVVNQRCHGAAVASVKGSQSQWFISKGSARNLSHTHILPSSALHH